MRRLYDEEIQKMFSEFELAGEEDRKRYRDLASLGSVEEPLEELTRIDCTTDDLPTEPIRTDAKLA